MIVYPIKFHPILKEKIWGGNKLNNILGKETNKNNVGESWEISDVNANISIVSNGFYKGKSIKDLMLQNEALFLGANNFNYYGANFPLLIKFLDAKTDLSVQVHPNNSMAKKHHNAFGKTEMWYIMDSDKNANIVLGLNDENTNSEILSHITSQNVDAIFNREKVEKGDCFFIPAGKIHAIGAGVLAAEIQQTSDITYRIYDWDRIDASGKKRDLHTKLAEKATKGFNSKAKSQYTTQSNKSINLVNCDYFTTNIIEIKEEQTKDYRALDSFVIFMCVEGSVSITTGSYSENLKMGETILLPAIIKEIKFNSVNGKLLEIYCFTL